jgi:hypothetical protein
VTYPLGNCLNSVFFLVPAVHTRPSSLHLLHGNSPSHCWLLEEDQPLQCTCSYRRTAGCFTFVFFILHLSHAFHTLLCLASAIDCVDWLSDGIGEWTCGCDTVVLERLVTRCAGLVGFALGLCLFAVGCDLCCPSRGGLGRLCSIFVYGVAGEGGPLRLQVGVGE